MGHEWGKTSVTFCKLMLVNVCNKNPVCKSVSKFQVFTYRLLVQIKGNSHLFQ